MLKLLQQPLAEEDAALEAKRSTAEYAVKTPEPIKAKDAKKLAKAQVEYHTLQGLLEKMSELLQSQQ